MSATETTSSRIPSDEQALRAAIAAAPHDDAPKLILADWLDEHGAEVVVPQVKLQRGYDRCDQCRRVPCELCGALMPPLRGPKVCSACRPARRAEQAHASYLRNAEAVKRRSAERAKRERAAGNPVYAAQDKRKWARIKADPAKLAQARQKARDWWAANRERILAERAAKREPWPERECPECGRSYSPKRPQSVYCSMGCRRAAALRPRPVLPAKPCVHCGAEFVPSHPRRLTCSAACRSERHRQQIEQRAREQYLAGLSEAARRIAERESTATDRRVPCRYCGTPFLPGRRKRKRFCGRPCKEAFRAESTATRPCVVCGREFAGRKRTDKTCSANCAAEHKRRLERERLARSESARAAKTERERARVDRDSYTCRVCGKSLADSPDLRTNRYTCSPECRREALRQKSRRSYLNRKGRQPSAENCGHCRPI
jgi:uncharacterized protein (TIGR02996 family)